jgi:hypothetical protein
MPLKGSAFQAEALYSHTNDMHQKKCTDDPIYGIKQRVHIVPRDDVTPRLVVLMRVSVYQWFTFLQLSSTTCIALVPLLVTN